MIVLTSGWWQPTLEHPEYIEWLYPEEQPWLRDFRCAYCEREGFIASVITAEMLNDPDFPLPGFLANRTEDACQQLAREHLLSCPNPPRQSERERASHLREALRHSNRATTRVGKYFFMVCHPTEREYEVFTTAPPTDGDIEKVTCRYAAEVVRYIERVTGGDYLLEWAS